MQNSKTAVCMRDITKTFGSVVANDKVSIDINKQEILALLGENGSGKTTLIVITSYSIHYTKLYDFREWIGAQMRGAVCGMVAPGDAMEAARLAWMDGSVSHHNNGILGEVFNAVLVSLSFVRNNFV